jgi:hypothetical protein
MTSEVDHVDAAMRRLMEPEPPAGLASTVMARIERLPVPEPGRSREAGRSRRDVAAWVWTVAGALLVFGLASYGSIKRGGTLDLASLHLNGSANLLPTEGVPLVVLVVGLALFTTGLFVQVGGVKHQP